MKIKMKKSNKYSLIEYIFVDIFVSVCVCACALDECSWYSIRLSIHLLQFPTFSILFVCFSWLFTFPATNLPLEEEQKWKYFYRNIFIRKYLLYLTEKSIKLSFEFYMRKRKTNEKREKRYFIRHLHTKQSTAFDKFVNFFVFFSTLPICFQFWFDELQSKRRRRKKLHHHSACLLSLACSLTCSFVRINLLIIM